MSTMIASAIAAGVEAALAEVETTTLTDQVAASARELSDIRDAMKVMEKREKELREVMLEHLRSIGQDADTDGTVSISRHDSERTGINMDKMRALYPKVLADVESKTPVVQVRVKIRG